MNRLFCFLMSHKNKLQMLRIAIIVTAVAIAAAAPASIMAGPFDDYP